MTATRGHLDAWGGHPLGTLVSIEKGRVVRTTDNTGGSAIPYIGADSFGGVYRLFTSDASAIRCEPTDVLMLWDGERSGLVATGLRGAIGSTVARLRPTDGVDGRFLFHQLAHSFGWIQARRTGTGVPHVPKDIATILRVYLPDDITLQRRIAAVLDAVDATIAKTEAVIAKLKCVRAGLLHDLLTRGVDSDGQLRPPHDQAPQLYKASPLGPIPRDWEVCTTEELLAPVSNALRSGPFGSALLKQELVASGVPLLGIDNVHVERFMNTYVRFVSNAKFRELQRYAVRPRDVMITIMGTVGRCCVVPDDMGKALSSKHVWTITFDQPRYVPELACWQMNHAPWVLAQLRRDEQGGIMTAIRSDTIRNLRFPVPTAEEQRKMLSVLKQGVDQVRSDEQTLLKLQKLKSGLAADLLKGRVRVPDNLMIGRGH